MLLLDEPFSALDAFTRASLHEHLLGLWEETRPTVVLVTHDVQEAVTLADRAVVMQPKPGRIFDELPLALARPRDKLVACLRERDAARACSALDRSLNTAHTCAAREARPARRPRCGGRIRTARTIDPWTHRRRSCAPFRRRSRTSTAPSPNAAVITLKAQGTLDDQHIACKVETGRALAIAGLHPATGGTGAELCSGDMLLEALVACAGVTLKAVATALEIALRDGTVKAEGDLDFRGTLGVDKTAPVGFRAIRLALRARHRRAAGEDRPAAQADRALLRRVPDAEQQARAQRASDRGA